MNNVLRFGKTVEGYSIPVLNEREIRAAAGSLFFESAFGICLGCQFYSLVYRKPPTLCPGEVCDVRSRQDIQRTSAGQWIVLAVTVALVAAAAFAFSKSLAIPARALFGG